ncbi:hypothetical protein LPJ66_007849 [Kickxella alabastrina]|uniref:Uncharacterized protein n=1 Tax=Kickxella alabastrina TaxID=61397 RepID=A0ACC1I961_9FUNG|nr:hypothetical protein LPJ66_007849 [Kickxella alabastrina]
MGVQKQQTRTGSLKSFVRVGKATDAPMPKDNLAKPATRMTRSKAAAALESATIENQELVVETPAPMERKRKLANLAPTEPKEVAKRPVKVAVRGGKATTIGAYFPVATVAVAYGSAVEEAVEAVEIEAVEGSKEDLDRRARVLLGRLRSRKASTSASDEASAAEASAAVSLVPSAIEQTREIQASIRALRETITETTTNNMAKPSPSIFASTIIPTTEDLYLRALRRQFVSISPQPGSAQPLPRSMRKLEELFQALEHTILFDSKDASMGVIYHRIRKSVEVMAKRTFGWHELGQILAVYPESYTFGALPTMHEGRRVVSVELKPRAHGLQMAVEMDRRRVEFRKRLVRIVEAEHGGFLARRGYTETDISAVRGWHPEFDIEATPMVTPIAMPPATLPLGNQSASPLVATFDRNRLKHLLGQTTAALAQAPAQEQADLVPEPTTAVAAALAATKAAAAAIPKEKPITKAQELLERIRAKQRAKELQKQNEAPVVPASTRTMHSRLPGILEALSFMFYSERKSVLPFFFVVDRIAETKGLDKAEAAVHLVEMSAFVPEWCVVVREDGAVMDRGEEPVTGARMKVTRSIGMQEAKARLEAKIAEKL